MSARSPLFACPESRWTDVQLFEACRPPSGLSAVLEVNRMACQIECEGIPAWPDRAWLVHVENRAALILTLRRRMAMRSVVVAPN